MIPFRFLLCCYLQDTDNLEVVTEKMIRIPDHKNFCKVVLDTRDIEDSDTIFGFPVSTHKKMAHF